MASIVDGVAAAIAGVSSVPASHGASHVNRCKIGRRGLRDTRRAVLGVGAVAFACTSAVAAAAVAKAAAFAAGAPALANSLRWAAATLPLQDSPGGCCLRPVPRRHKLSAIIARQAAKKATGTRKRTKKDASDDADSSAPVDGSRVPLSDLEVGQELEGIVVQWFFPGGVTVDVGATAEGFLEVEEFRDGFPTGTIAETFKPGDNVKVRVLDLEDYTIAESAKFHVTMRSGDLTRPPRYVGEGIADVTPFLEAKSEDWFDGEVTLMSTWAVFVKVASPGTGKPFVGILYKEEFRPGSDFENQVIRGGPCRVRVKEVDTECRRLLLTMRDPGDEAPPVDDKK